MFHTAINPNICGYKSLILLSHHPLCLLAVVWPPPRDLASYKQVGLMMNHLLTSNQSGGISSVSVGFLDS